MPGQFSFKKKLAVRILIVKGQTPKAPAQGGEKEGEKEKDMRARPLGTFSNP